MMAPTSLMVRTCGTGLDHIIVADSSSGHTHEPPMQKLQLLHWKTLRSADQRLLHLVLRLHHANVFMLRTVMQH